MIPIVPLNKGSIETKCDDLLKRIEQDLKLNIEQIIVPSAEQSTTNAAYSSYVRLSYRVIAPKLERVYANPVAKLEEVDALMAREETVIEPAKLSLNRQQLDAQLKSPSPFIKGPHTKEFNEFVGDFEASVKKLNLHDGLICPVTLGIYKEPYVLPSSQVIDREGLFYTDSNGKAQRVKECPLTRKPLKSHPPRLKDYDKALESSLRRYHEKVEAIQMQAKMKTNDEENRVAEQRTASSLAMNSKRVESSSFREQVDCATSRGRAWNLFKLEKKTDPQKVQEPITELTHL